MYGYLRIYNNNYHSAERKIFTNYYCKTCAALRAHYGIPSSLTLSFDLVIVPLIILEDDRVPARCAKCNIGKSCKKNGVNNDLWKKIGAFNVAMAYSHIIDDVLDDGKKVSFKIKTARLMLKGAIKKGRKNCPEMFQLGETKMHELAEIEKNNASLEMQQHAFAEMCILMMNEIRELTENEKEFVYLIASWLCLIDALDDYDEDKKENKYNPLLTDPSLSYKEYVSQHYLEINDLYQSIYNRLVANCKTFAKRSTFPLFASLVYNTIPMVTAAILKGTYKNRRNRRTRRRNDYKFRRHCCICR